VAIEKIGGSMQGISLINWGKTGLEKDRAHNVVDGAENALSPPILL
jgi:hypothetical protein